MIGTDFPTTFFERMNLTVLHNMSRVADDYRVQINELLIGRRIIDEFFALVRETDIGLTDLVGDYHCILGGKSVRLTPSDVDAFLIEPGMILGLTDENTICAVGQKF